VKLAADGAEKRPASKQGSTSKLYKVKKGAAIKGLKGGSDSTIELTTVQNQKLDLNDETDRLCHIQANNDALPETVILMSRKTDGHISEMPGSKITSVLDEAPLKSSGRAKAKSSCVPLSDEAKGNDFVNMKVDEDDVIHNPLSLLTSKKKKEEQEQEEEEQQEQQEEEEASGRAAGGEVGTKADEVVAGDANAVSKAEFGTDTVDCLLVYCAYHSDNITLKAANAASQTEPTDFGSGLHQPSTNAKALIALLFDVTNGTFFHIWGEEKRCGKVVNKGILLPAGLEEYATDEKSGVGIVYACYGSNDVTNEVTIQYATGTRKFEASNTMWGNTDGAKDKSLFVFFRSTLQDQLTHLVACEEEDDQGSTMKHLILPNGLPELSESEVNEFCARAGAAKKAKEHVKELEEQERLRKHAFDERFWSLDMVNKWAKYFPGEPFPEDIGMRIVGRSTDNEESGTHAQFMQIANDSEKLHKLLMTVVPMSRSPLWCLMLIAFQIQKKAKSKPEDRITLTIMVDCIQRVILRSMDAMSQILSEGGFGAQISPALSMRCGVNLDVLEIAVLMHDRDLISVPRMTNFLCRKFHCNIQFGRYSRPEVEAAYSLEGFDNFFRFNPFKCLFWLSCDFQEQHPEVGLYVGALFHLAVTGGKRSLRTVPPGQGVSPSEAIGPFAAPMHHFWWDLLVALTILAVQVYALLTMEEDKLGAAEVIVLAWGTGKLVAEVMEIRVQSWVQYLSDAWNVIDLVVITLTAVVIYFRSDGLEENFSGAKKAMCVINILTWTNLLPFLMMQKDLGPLVLVIVYMTKTLLQFALLIAVFFAGFAIPFYALLRDDPDAPHEFVDVAKLLFSAMFGDFYLDFGDGQYAEFLAMMMVFYELTMGLLLLNMLIALLSVDLAEVQESKVKEYNFSYCCKVLEYKRRVERNFIPAPLNLLLLVHPDSAEIAHTAFLLSFVPSTVALYTVLAIAPLVTLPIVFFPHGPVGVALFWFVNLLQSLCKLLLGFGNLRLPYAKPKFAIGDSILVRLSSNLDFRMPWTGFEKSMPAVVTRVHTSRWLGLKFYTYDVTWALDEWGHEFEHGLLECWLAETISEKAVVTDLQKEKAEIEKERRRASANEREKVASLIRMILTDELHEQIDGDPEVKKTNAVSLMNSKQRQLFMIQMLERIYHSQPAVVAAGASTDQIPI
jgi:hypothetical protein